jgi:drug/metabolite transporter (DMT)-like permease
VATGVQKALQPGELPLSNHGTGRGRTIAAPMPPLMPPESRHRLAQILLFVTPLLWSANYIGARAAVGVIGPHQLALARWLIAFLVMLPFALPALRRAWPRWHREWRTSLVLGALGMWICGAFVYIGAETSPAVNIGLIYALAPVLIAVLSIRLLGERLRAVQVAGAALALCGVAIILFKGSFANLLAIQLTRGDIWIGVAVLSWTAYSLILKHKNSVLDPMARLAIITLAGVIVLVPFTIVETVIIGLPQPGWNVVGLILMVALLPGLGAYQSYSYVQKELGAARTGLILYLGPIYAALVAWALLGEQPQWFHALGAALILPGIYLATRTDTRRSAG